MPAMGHWNTPMEGTTMFSLETIWKVSAEEAMESHAVVRSENKVSDKGWEQSEWGLCLLGTKNEVSCSTGKLFWFSGEEEYSHICIWRENHWLDGRELGGIRSRVHGDLNGKMREGLDCSGI